MKCFIACSGVGRISRGYESFARECYDALCGNALVEMFLFKGAGPSNEHERSIWSLDRNGKTGKWLGQTTGRGPYYIEQVTFTLSLLRWIKKERPDVILFSDTAIGNALWHWRRKTGQRYRLLFSNGGPVAPPFPRWDHTQQVTVTHLNWAMEAGEPAEKMTLLPYGFVLPPRLELPTDEQRKSIRQNLDLPIDRDIVLSIGAINSSHKRMDQLVREVAATAEPRPYLAMLGQADDETRAIRKLADELLGSANYCIRTVPQERVKEYASVADVFVLASINEGFGRAMVEAASVGLPCITHDYPVAREVLQTDGHFVDALQTGTIAAAIQHDLRERGSARLKLERAARIYQRLSWDALKDRYVEMILKIAR